MVAGSPKRAGNDVILGKLGYLVVGFTVGAFIVVLTFDSDKMSPGAHYRGASSYNSPILFGSSCLFALTTIGRTSSSHFC